MPTVTEWGTEDERGMVAFVHRDSETGDWRGHGWVHRPSADAFVNNIKRRFIWNSALMALVLHQRIGRQFRERQRRS